MYRISIVRNPSAKGVYTKGYFGPCFKEDVMSSEEIEKYRNPNNYINISSLFSKPDKIARFQNLLKEAKVGSLFSWSNFRKDKKYILHMCIKGDRNVANSIHFLRPEYAEYLGFPGSPIVINTWRQLDKESRSVIEENYIPEQRDYKTRSGDVVKAAYTGSVDGLLNYQNELIGRGESFPFSVNVWGRFLEGKKELKLYSVDKKLRETAKDKSLSPEEKQQKFNEILEESFYGLEIGEKLYKYTVDPKSDSEKLTAQLTVDHGGISKTRNIATEGFTKKEWRGMVLGGKFPATIKKDTPDNEVTKILNGVSKSVERSTKQPQIKYTGEHPHTLEKMRLTGLFPNKYYTQNEWYNSLTKVEVLEDKTKPFNEERQKKYKLEPSEMPLEEDYKTELANFNLQKELGEDVKSRLLTVGQKFRKRLERAGISDVKSKLEEIKSSTDTFAIEQFMIELQSMDNLFIDSCYTKQIGSTGEKVLKQTLTKNLGPDYQYQRTLSINVYPPGSEKSYLLIFDGAILKSASIVMLFEVQGNQHYAFNQRHYKTYNDFQQRLYRDKLKLDFCKQNDIPLFTISNVLDSSEAASVYEKLASSGTLSSFIPKGTKEDYNLSNLREENIDEWVSNYVDSLIVSHFNPIIKTNSHDELIPKINRIMVDLSKLVMIAITNKYNSQLQDTSFMQDFSKQTLLDEGHRMLVDSFNKYFGNNFKMDYLDKVTYIGPVIKPRESKPIKTQEPLPVQEMSYRKHKKKYKIRRLS